MSQSFDLLIELMTRLRGDKGCPWDKQQTHESLKPYLIEETHEVIEAIDKRDSAHLEEELGDLLLQIVFHSEIEREKGGFSIDDVITGLVEKLKGRHPHVFGDADLHSSEQVLKNWEKNKMLEKKGSRESYLDGVPPTLPGLMRAQKIQKKAARAGFDWRNNEEVIEKFKEEWAELAEAMQSKNEEKIEEEMGDLFFTLVNLARTFKLDAEQTLGGSIEKFIFRFKAMERQARKNGVLLEDLDPAGLDRLWLTAKKLKDPP